ncbi:MAG TPA: toxic anion resistance protein [Massilibacterium sp.]|nr:toxic anion resistance protein [Massilibacterium sp.]
MSENKKEELQALDVESISTDDLLNNPFQMPTVEVQEELQPVEKSEKALIETLSIEDQKKAKAIANQIDPTNQQAIVQYGVAAQTDLSRFSHSILQHVQTKDTGPVGDVLKELMVKIQEVDINDFNQQKPGIFSRIFGSMQKQVSQLTTKYKKVGTEIDQIADKLEQMRQSLLRDVVMLDTLFNKNKEYFEVLNVYIAAGDYKVNELRNETLPALKKQAESSGNQMKIQEVNDLMQFTDRLEKRNHDLKLSRQITMQTAPQIRMIQNMNQVLIEKIQSSILTAIPLWKNQLVIALTLFRQEKALESQKQVTKTTNELLLKNSELLKTNTIETAKENERGIVEIETLKKTQENLIETLEETLKIQQEGRTKRQEAEKELVQLEEDLKTKLLSIS